MVHTVCGSEYDQVVSYFQQLFEILLAPDRDFRTKLEQLFEKETDEFSLDTAFLTRVDLELETQQFEVVHGSHGPLQAGNSVPLSQSYCRKTITHPTGTSAVNDAQAEGWGEDPAYQRFGLASYVGTTVSIEDGLYGTLCFADRTPRTEQITDEEKTLLEILSQWVEYELEQWDGPPTHATLWSELTADDISSNQLDVMLSVLSNRLRRLTLTTLLPEDDECSIETVEQTLDAENARLKLRHNHLPRLKQRGYVEWNPNSGTISRGPNFSEIEPLLRQLQPYSMGA